MTTESAPVAQRAIFAGGQTGFRRLTPGFLEADRAAACFNGLPEGVTSPTQLLAALKAVAPRLGLQHRLVYALDWLFRFTQPQDWGRGRRPIVWPSAAMQEEEFGLSPTQVRATNRALIEAGLVTMKDSPNGKRYGRRDRQGHLVEAYGFDLSPLAAHYAEYIRLAAEVRTEREERRRFRRRASIARNNITQILKIAAEYDLPGDEWTDLSRDSRRIAETLRQAERNEEMAFAVESLERRLAAARERLNSLVAVAVPTTSETVISAAMPTEYRAHQYSYKPAPDPNQDTVIALEVSRAATSQDSPTLTQPEAPQGRKPEEGRGEPDIEETRADPKASRSTGMRLAPAELLHLAPRLRTYLKSARPAWPEIVEAADWLRTELDVSKSLWGDACLTMGREQAAVAIAIVSAKPAEHFRSTAGGYFCGMVAKAKAGELDLARTVWGLRHAAAGRLRGRLDGPAISGYSS
ncbi:MAG: plasmid replication protein RepC [Terracidiphilus sp.]|nr:plasmid replication protein RepC [Terracidiphilus sp.]